MPSLTDLAAAAFAKLRFRRGSVSVLLVRSQHIVESGNSDPYTGAAQANILNLTLKVKQAVEDEGEIDVIVEHSADGESWETLHAFDTVDGRDTQHAELTPPWNDYLRVSWTVTGPAEWTVTLTGAAAAQFGITALGGSQPLTARIPISSAEILTFGTAVPRKVIVAAQGAGTVIVPRIYAIQYLFGGNAYTPTPEGGASFALGWGDDGNGVWEVDAHSTFDAAIGGGGILEQTTDKFKLSGDGCFDFDVNGTPGVAITAVEDTALTFGLSTGSTPVLDGDGTLVVIVTYDVIDL